MILCNGTVSIENGDGDVILIQIQNLVFGTVQFSMVLKTRTESFLCVYQTTS